MTRRTSTRTALSVNLNKVAVLRNSRGGREPDVLAAARTCIAAGCDGITVHPRPDQRHIRPDDVRALAALLPAQVEFNIEGNPLAPARGDYPGLLALVEQTRPAQVTLVPDSDGQLTSDHGYDLAQAPAALAEWIAAARALGARVSLFVDDAVAEIERAAALGAQRVEIYTGPYAEAFAAGAAAPALARIAALVTRAHAAGLEVNAGHDLSQANLGALLAAAPGIAEVSIGHALIGEALYAGLDATVRAYLAVIAAAADTGAAGRAPT